MEKSEEFNSGELPEGEEEEDEETKETKRKEVMRMRQDKLVERSEKKDFLRRMMKDRSIAEEEQLLQHHQEARELKILEEKFERNLAEELSCRKNAEIVQKKREQALRRDSIELRRLDEQVRNEHAARASKVQLFERAIGRENAKMQEIEDARKIRDWYQLSWGKKIYNENFEKQQMLEARKKKEQYRRDLQGQIVLNHRLRQQKTEETRHERKLVEELNEVLRLENLENQRRKREATARMLAEERAFFETREFWKSTEKQRLLKEDEEHARIAADKIVEHKRSNDAKAAVAAAKEALLKKMTKKMEDDESKRRERTNIGIELFEIEEMNKLESLEKSLAAEKNIISRGLLEDMKRQKAAIEERKIREAEVDRAFADYLARERDKSIAADKRKEEDCRARGIEYGKTLKKAITSKSISYATEILERQTMLEQEQKLNEARRIFVEEQRSKILEEHKQRMRGFLKPGPDLVGSQACENNAPSPCNN